MRRAGFAAILIGSCLLATPLLVSAHSANQLPFVRINGEDALIYPVGSTSLSDLVLPQDVPPHSYLVGQSVTFSLLPENLPFAPETIPNVKVNWDFGDGNSSTDRTVSHTYSKMGSYVVNLTSTVPAEGVDDPQSLDIIMINVIPTADYKLPTAAILVNGQQSKNALTDILNVDFNSPVTFEASKSGAGSSTIDDYFWDFGDQQKGASVSATHMYSTQWSYISALLRIKTKDGFFADAMVQLQNPSPVALSLTPTPSASAQSGKDQRRGDGRWLAGVLLGMGLVAVAVGGRMFALRKRHGN